MDVPKFNRKDQGWMISDKANVHLESSDRRVLKTDKI